MAEQSFTEWMGSPHLQTFIQLRLRELDRIETGLGHLELIGFATRRNELRILETWRPTADAPIKPEAQAKTNLKAGEYFRTLTGRAQ